MDPFFLENVLTETLQRIFAVVQPTKVILFGSAVKGELGKDSDIDLLVVVPSGLHRRKTTQNIYKNLIGVGFAVDIIVVTEKDIEQFKNDNGLIIRTALEEGRVLYGT